MKLRLLELTNVRRFGGQTARLGPFGDGLTTITAENEAGKSTFFDALHALFFISHTSRKGQIKALQPYSGGAVHIAAEIDIDGTGYRIEKAFISSPSAKIIDRTTGQILKQQGDAEQWLEAQVNSAHKGPAGLLWVRQGDVGIDAGGQETDNLAARRDLMSSVRGHIDAVTGGRRMDAIVARCRRDFDALSTQAIKAKAGSPWKAIEDTIARLIPAQEKLVADVAKLSQALKLKAAAERRLRALQDPKAQASRAAQIAKASAALEQAKDHAQNRAKAEQALQLVQSELEKHQRDIKEISDARTKRARLADQIAQTRAQVAQASEQQSTADLALREIKSAVAENEATRRALNVTLTEARSAEALVAKWNRLQQIDTLLARLKAPERKLADANQVLQGPRVTQSDVDALTQFSQAISVAREQRRVQFASVTLHPSGCTSAQMDGAPLTAETPHLIDRPLRLEIEGFGRIDLKPAEGAGVGVDDPDSLQANLNAQLEALGFTTRQAAQEALTGRHRAENDARVARAEMAGLAPEGAAALRAEYDALCAELGHPKDTPVLRPQTSPQTTTRLEMQMAKVETTLDTLSPQLAACQQTASQAVSDAATANGLLRYHLEEQDNAKPPAEEDQRLATLETQSENAATRAEKAARKLRELKESGPDLLAAQSTHDRLQDADRADKSEIETLRRDLARADGAIEAQSEGAVEENLAQVTAELEKARILSMNYAKKASALKLLSDHLDAARKGAQDTYFQPIRSELRPLLAQLHADAAFEIDPDSMLPGSITRGGVTDEIAVLSGGAQEQVAILTRLAFARLFAKQGRHLPVILDDALVHTDDARISTMFNMLSQVAKDQQIIVLSCRTRAFSDLGGIRAFIEVTEG